MNRDIGVTRKVAKVSEEDLVTQYATHTKGKEDDEVAKRSLSCASLLAARSI
jgi:hypothetical protein